MDTISGNIARQLYQKNTIAVKGYEEVELPDSFFDVALGNVPFGDFKLTDRRYDKNNFLIHDYFFAKTLDKVRPNGVIAFITSKGTMDKQNDKIRKYICQRAELIGSIRLPNNTFKANAGTIVTSDIIFLKKRDKITDIEDEWVHLDKNQDGIEMNSYFVKHPEMILGRMEMTSGRFGPESTCSPIYSETLETQLDNAIESINAEIDNIQIDEISDNEEVSIPATPDVRNFSYTEVDNKVYYRENSLMYLQDKPITTLNRIKGMIEIRDCVRKIIDLQIDDAPDFEITSEQQKLNRLYDNFSKKYGLINSRGNEIAFSDDEKEIADLVEVYLKNENYNVFKFYDSKEAIKCIENQKLDFAILDVMIKDVDGFEICKMIRDKGLNFPVIMLTAKIEDKDKIQGLTLGADDYITKPFNPLELIARVKSAYRRYTKYNEKNEENIIYINGLEIDQDKHICKLYDKQVELTPMEFDILLYLAQKRGNVVSSEELFEKVWKEKYLENNNTVMVHIRRIREKLNEDTKKPKFIKTVWGVGYKIEK